MSKQYQGWEIVKMISEKTLNNGDLIQNKNFKFKIVDEHLEFADEKDNIFKIEELGISFLTNKYDVFEIIEKPVSFMEAVSSEKNMIKVDIEDVIDGISDNLKEQLREYNTIGATLYCLSNYFTNESLVKIFQEGKWYIEEQ